MLFPFNHYIDDTDLYFAPFDLHSISDPSFNPDQRQIVDKFYNPFLDDDDSRQLLMNSDIDPDRNILVNNADLLSNCIYLTSK